MAEKILEMVMQARHQGVPDPRLDGRMREGRAFYASLKAAYGGT